MLRRLLNPRTALPMLLALLLVPVSAHAQTAELRGAIVDQTGASLPGASVTIKNTDTGVERTATADERGSFRAAALPPGPYSIVAELQGFRPGSKTLTLTVGQTASVRIELGVGAVTETVEVNVAAEQVETSKSDLSGVVSRDELAELPVLNRGFIGLAQLLPGGGPSRSGDSRFGIQTAFGGTNVRSMYSLQIDGGVMDHPIYGFAIVNVSQDAVQEFRVLRNQFDAEYSRAGTAIVNVVTRSGTNDFRGSASYFGRSDSLNEKNFFAKTKQPFDLTRASVTFGGPLVKNRTHFFAAGEYLDQGSVRIIALPASNPFAGTYNGNYPNGTNEKTAQAKLDHVFSPRHSLNLRYLWDDQKIDETYELAENFSITFNHVSSQWSFSHSSGKLNTVLFEFLDQDTQRFQKVVAAQVTRPSFTAGSSPNLPQGFPRKRFALNETFYWLAGRHTMKFGARAAYEILKYNADYYGQGVWLFNTDRAFNAADRTTWPTLYTTGSGPQIQTYKNYELGFFAQDDLKLGSRLTLNLGLRYDIDTNLRSNDFIASLVADPQFRGLDQILKSPRGNDTNQIQPRVGFAWDIKGNGRTVLRGGYGGYSGRNRPWFNIRGQVVSTQFTAEVSDPNLLSRFPDRTAVLGGRSVGDYVRTAGGRALYLPGDNLKLPYSHNFSIGIAKVLFADTTLEVDGIRQTQKDLQTGRDHNLPARGPLSQNPRPFPQFASVTLIDGLTTSYYTALQTTFKTRYKKARFQVAYTWAKSISDGTNDNASTNTDPFKTAGSDDRGVDENDRRHAVSITSLVELPLGIKLSGIVFFRGGNPWEINTGLDLDGDGSRQDRPRGLVKNSGGQKSQANLDIINAFRASRNLAPITMERLTQSSGDTLVDLRATKQFRLGNSRSLDVFLEAYNLFNSVNYENPSGVMTSGSFAIRTIARDPRQIQWGARLNF